MPGDRDKARRRKLKALDEAPGGVEDWRRYKTCELCGTLFVVNDYEDRRSRTPRILKRVCCPWCEGRRGRRRMIEHVVFERLADLPCLNNRGGDPFEDDPDCKCLRCIANRVIISDRRKELGEDVAGR